MTNRQSSTASAGRRNRQTAKPPTQGHRLSARDIRSHTVEADRDERVYDFFDSDCAPARDLTAFAKRVVTSNEAATDELTRILAPNDVKEFLSAYFDNRPIILRAANHDRRFARYYSRAHMHEAFSTGRIDPDNVKLVTAKGEFCTERLFGDPARGRTTRAGRIIQFVETKGGTFNVSRIYNHSNEVAELTDVLNRLFKARISASAFFTGPRGQAFPVHWDTFDTMIFQVEGQKNWTIYEPMIQGPLPDLHYCTRYDMSRLKVMFETDLTAGDLMLVPRGYPHKAKTKRSMSIHLTVGVHTPTWYDFIGVVLNRALAETRTLDSFRLDCHLSHAPGEAGNKHARQMLEEFVRIADRILSSEYFMEYCAVHQGSLIEAASNGGPVRLRTDSVLERKGGFHVLEQVGDSLHLTFKRDRLVLPAYVKETLEFMASTPRFAVKDLPDGLDTGSQIRLAERLCQIGLLAPSAPHG